MMRIFITRLAVLCAAASLLILSACSGSDEETTPETPSSESTKHQVSEPMHVFPAVGVKRGVVRHGKSVESDDPFATGLSYTCKAGFVPVKVGYLDQVNFNGLIIRYTTDKSSYDNYTFGVMLTFGGVNRTAFTSRVKSMIVETFGRSTKNHIDFTDDYVVNVTSRMIGRGMYLRRASFDFANLSDVKFCLTK